MAKIPDSPNSPNSNVLILFCDGACSGNPGPGGWGVIVAFPNQVKELGGAAAHTTNNQMELTAAIRALENTLDSPLPARLYTDSSYVINGITKWVFNWSRNGWKTKEGKDVLNRELWIKLDSVVKKKPGKIEWCYVPGHSGVTGNERVDEIAVAFCSGSSIDLFNGPRESYSVNLEAAIPQRAPGSPSKKSKAAVTHYLSLVGKKALRHKTWKECEARVRGVSGAKYKKISSAQEEAATLDDWGAASPEDS